MYASQKAQVFSSLRRPQTPFWHAKGHKRAGALTGSIIIIQNTFITAYEENLKRQIMQSLKKDQLPLRSDHRDFSSKLLGELEWKTNKKRKSNVALQC